MATTKNTSILAQAGLSRLQFPPLLDTCLPQVMTDIAEVRGAKTEIMRLSLTTIPALPSQELGPMFRALQLPLGGTSAANKFHGEGSLYVFIQVVLFLLRSATLYLAAIIRLSALGAFVECHFCHC
jgi:hypothetical protein